MLTKTILRLKVPFAFKSVVLRALDMARKSGFDGSFEEFQRRSEEAGAVLSSCIPPAPPVTLHIAWRLTPGKRRCQRRQETGMAGKISGLVPLSMSSTRSSRRGASDTTATQWSSPADMPTVKLWRENRGGEPCAACSLGSAAGAKWRTNGMAISLRPGRRSLYSRGGGCRRATRKCNASDWSSEDALLDPASANPPAPPWRQPRGKS